MKTPWSKLLHYGEGFAALAVILIAGLIMFSAIGLAVLLAKLSAFIK